MKLWIDAGNDAGNYAESYRKAAGLAARIEPWSGLVGYRSILAHQSPEDLNPDRLWYDVNDARAVLADIDDATQP
jgi:hypothetical protein